MRQCVNDVYFVRVMCWLTRRFYVTQYDVTAFDSVQFFPDHKRLYFALTNIVKDREQISLKPTTRT